MQNAPQSSRSRGEAQHFTTASAALPICLSYAACCPEADLQQTPGGADGTRRPRPICDATDGSNRLAQALVAAAATEGGGRLRLSDDLSQVRVGAGENSGDGDSGATECVTIPAGPLRHFVYHVPARRQYLAPAPPPDAAQVRLFRHV